MPTAHPTRLDHSEIARHAHVGAYATLVLSGGYEEAGDAGRFKVSEGDVLIHAPFSAHRDAVSSASTTVLDLPLPFDARAWPSRAAIANADTVLAAARRDATEAALHLLDALRPAHTAERDLPDLLARDLSNDPTLAIAEWSSRHAIARETAWRQFRSAYGVDAARYRAEARARRAWRLILGSSSPLADIALTAGFADQAHMSRAVKALTGRTPGDWRRRPATSVQDGPTPRA